jgi:hypothetical protein
MLQISNTLLHPKPEYGNGNIEMKVQGNWNFARRKFLLTNTRVDFRAFTIAVPPNHSASVSNDEYRDTDLERLQVSCIEATRGCSFEI